MTGRYCEDKASSAEILRLALQRISVHPAAFNPLTYAVWYEFVAGINAPLANSLGEMLAAGKPIDDAAILELYRKHIAESDIEAGRAFKQSMERVLEEVRCVAEQTGSDAGRFNAGLQRHEKRLSRELDADALRELIDEVTNDTQTMHASVGSLQNKLQESKAEIDRLQQELLNARSEASIDPLTGVLNRRGFESQIRGLSDQPGAAGKQASLLMVDVDLFKKINDTYGHLFGDKVIRVVAEVLKSQLKGQDIVARMGGEEFAVLLPDTPLAGAHTVAESIRQKIEQGKIRRQDKDEGVGGITVSIGIAPCAIGSDWQLALEKADKALYASKQAGRNRTTIHEMPA